MKIKQEVEVDVTVDVELEDVMNEIDEATFEHYAKQKGFVKVDKLTENPKNIVKQMICDLHGLPYVTEDQEIMIKLTKMFNP